MYPRRLAFTSLGHGFNTDGVGRHSLRESTSRTPGLFALFVSSHVRHQKSLPSQVVQLKLSGPWPSSNENPDVSSQPSFPALPRSSNSAVCCQQTDSQAPCFLDRAANPRWRLVPWPNKTATPPTDHRRGEGPTAGGRLHAVQLSLQAPVRPCLDQGRGMLLARCLVAP
jgi:hypothetical protein